MAEPKAPSSGRGYHHGDLRRALLDAAESLMAEGTDDPGLRAVARRAGVSHAAPYKHFADRTALRADVAARGFDDLKQRMHAAAGSEPDRPLRAVGRAYVAFALERPALYRLMFGPEFAGGGGTPELDRAAGEAFETLVRTGADDSPPATAQAQAQAQARTTAVAQWSLVHGLATLLIDGRVGVPEGTCPLDFATQAMGSLTPAGR